MNLFQTTTQRSSFIGMVLIICTLIIVPEQINAQRRGDRSATHRVKKNHRIKYLPRGFNQYKFGKQRFFNRRGLFYRKNGNAYILITAPIGFRIKHLPIGFTLVYFSGQPYYYYYGTYYRFDTNHDEYIVCEKPAVDDDDGDFNHYAGLDEIHMVNGKIYHGKFLGGDADYIKIDINGTVKKIPVSEIISIEYAAPLESEDE